MGMDRLWAPWRMEYIKQVDKGDGCFLCRAAASRDDRADMVLWRSEHSFAMLNLWPYNNGHILVAHNEHRADLADMTDAELLDQIRLLKRCQRNLEAVMSPNGFNVGLNLGRTAGAGVVDHAHWHIVPPLGWRLELHARHRIHKGHPAVPGEALGASQGS